MSASSSLAVCFLFGTVFILSCASAPNVGGTGFSVHQTLVLTRVTDGADGSLEVLRDRRLTEADIKALQEHDPDTNPENSFRFSSDPLIPARLALRSKEGRVLQLLPLEKTFGLLEAVEIADGRRAILVTQDFGIGMGSYNGPITKILELTPNSMTWAMARESNGEKVVPITLMRSLKSAWNFVAALEGKEIFSVNCRPDEEAAGNFTTIFSIYRFDKSGWTVHSKSENLLWEADDGDRELGYALPERNKFPR